MRGFGWLSRWRAKSIRAMARWGAQEALDLAVGGLDERGLIEALERGADPNARRPGAESALERSAAQGWAEGVEALLRHGASARAVGPYGCAALSSALESAPRPLKCVKALLAAGADPNQTAPGGMSPLALAAIRKLGRETRALLAAGARPAGPSEQPAVIAALVSGSEEVMGLLLAAGADVRAARELAQSQGRLEWLDALQAQEERRQLAGETRAGARSSRQRAL